MTLLLYAIAEATVAEPHRGEPQPRGLADEPLSTLPSGDLAAFVSDVETVPEATPRKFLAYEQVIERLMSRGTVLPARFGTTAETEHEIKAMLAERQLEFLEALSRVKGAVEFAIRVPPPPDPTQDQPDSGTEYMNRLMDQSRQTTELAKQVEGAAQGLTISTRRTARSLACLVSRQQASEFLARTRARGLTVTGPWPPYSFVAR
jgi:Gas vesicle synthesis protein GvpL/GvpF